MTKAQIEMAIAVIAMLFAALAIQQFLHWLDPSPPCATDERCADLREINQQRD